MKGPGKGKTPLDSIARVATTCCSFVPMAIIICFRVELLVRNCQLIEAAVICKLNPK